jgi:translation machinery-associated protein 16
MPKSLHKVQKHIAKKKGRNAQLHEGSRDARIILRASSRDQRVEKGSSVRRRSNNQYLERIVFIKRELFGEDAANIDALNIDVPTPEPLSQDEIAKILDQYLSRYDVEYTEVKAARRAGRPLSSREQVLKSLRDSERQEHESGFWIPDLTDQKNVEVLKAWNGQWVALNNMKFVRVSSQGEVKPSIWPPTGNS